MKHENNIMVAAEDAEDARLVKEALSEEFTNLTFSLDHEAAVEDFERCMPFALILAFRNLEKSEQYYLGLFRLSKIIHTLHHSAIVLCRAEDVRQAYFLCRAERFDDYVQFWPLYDPQRLLMTVQRERNSLENEIKRYLLTDIRENVKKITELETVLSSGIAKGGEHTHSVRQALKRAEADITECIDRFSNGIMKDGLQGAIEVRNVSGLRQAVKTLNTGGIQSSLRAVNDALQPMDQWAADLKRGMVPHLESMRALKAMVETNRPRILIVDDDQFQLKLLSQMLRDMELDLEFAVSGVRALSIVSKRRPDLILMDVNMPGMSGIEVTRKLKSTRHFADIPIIMITAHGQKEYVTESVRAGASDYLLKPFDKKKVLTRIVKFLGI